MIVTKCLMCFGQVLTIPARVKDGRGKFCSKQCYWQYGRPANKGANHPLWRGDEVGYPALHAWVRRELGSPNKCDNCGNTTKKRYEWANISHEYKRDLTDWVRLCTSCHNYYDDTNRGKNRRK